MNHYDLIFITNIPAFYKINLFNRLASKARIKVIFISRKSSMREGDFYNYNCNFDHLYINDVDFEKRDKLKTLFKIRKHLKELSYSRLVFPGWEIKELFLLSILTKKDKNAAVIESSILETRLTGMVGMLKKMFLSRMAYAYPSGVLQREILNYCRYSGKVYLTHGVGIANQLRKPTCSKKICEPERFSSFKYLYVGRLAPEKNLSLLIDTFNDIGDELIIIGSGPEKEQLEKRAKNNITFLGYVNNSALADIYNQCNVFILPSLSEPWGLVVEEALALGLPVIVSDRVGCKDDLVNNNGLIFDANDKNSLKNAMEKMKKDYSRFYESANKYNMEKMYDKQINSYITSIAE